MSAEFRQRQELVSQLDLAHNQIEQLTSQVKELSSQQAQLVQDLAEVKTLLTYRRKLYYRQFPFNKLLGLAFLYASWCWWWTGDPSHLLVTTLAVVYYLHLLFNPYLGTLINVLRPN